MYIYPIYCRTGIWTGVPVLYVYPIYCGCIAYIYKLELYRWKKIRLGKKIRGMSPKSCAYVVVVHTCSSANRKKIEKTRVYCIYKAVIYGVRVLARSNRARRKWILYRAKHLWKVILRVRKTRTDACQTCFPGEYICIEKTDLRARRKWILYTAKHVFSVVVKLEDRKIRPAHAIWKLNFFACNTVGVL